MGISTDIGLNSGVNITKLVDQLVALSARTRDNLKTATTALEDEQAAVTELAAYVLTVRYVTDSLGKEDLYNKQKVSSSNAAALSGTVTGSPATGSYQFTPVRAAQSQQLLGSAFASDSKAIGAGALTFRFGDSVQRGLSLEALNGGKGIVRGQIRIGDRSGASAEIDLSSAQTIDDVLDAINSNTKINVTAVARDGSIRLIDNTGQTGSHLTVQEVGRGKTASSLGLAGIDVDASTADGADLLTLTSDTSLATLNDGAGVQISTVLPEISFTLRDGTTGKIDFSPLSSGSATSQQKETTLGDLVDVINSAEPGKLKAEIAADGKRLVLTDLTEGSSTFGLTAESGSDALSDLGLDAASVNGVITGRRILGGLKTVLLSSLGGGDGLGELGSVTLTDRSGASATVDLSAASTLDDVIDAVNQAGIGVAAQVNDAGTGILLEDTTGATTGSLTVANADETNTVYHLGLTDASTTTSVNAGSGTSLDTGDLHLQVVSYATRLSDLNGGRGVALGKIKITDSGNFAATIDLSDSAIQTVGDVIRAINQNAANVRAEINDTGDGIAIIDLEHGSRTLRVQEVDSTTAADLHLLGSAVTRNIGGVSTQVIDGSTTRTVQIDADDTLQDLRSKINALGAGVTATVISDGSSKPYHLVLSSDHSGRVGQLVVDSSQAGFSLQETSRAQDALLAIGGTGSGGLLITSSTGQFDEVLPGVRLTVGQASQTPVTITVDNSDTDLIANVKAMVENYNRFRTALNDYTAYDAQQDKRAILFGDGAALRLETETADLITSRYLTGSVQTLAEMGIDVGDDGLLTLDETAFAERYADDPEGVKAFFTTEDTGFSAKFEELSEQLAGQDVSLLAQRFKSLDRKIEANTEKIEFMEARLETERTRLLIQFYRMDLAIGKLKNQLSLIDQIQLITSDTSSSNSSSASTTDAGSLFSS